MNWKAKTFFEGDRAPEWAAKRGGRVCITGDIKHLSGCSHFHCALEWLLSLCIWAVCDHKQRQSKVFCDTHGDEDKCVLMHAPGTICLPGESLSYQKGAWRPNPDYSEGGKMLTPLFLGIGTGCPEVMWIHHPWRCSRLGWIRLWAVWSSCRCLCLLEGSWIRWPLWRSLPTQMILWKGEAEVLNPWPAFA